MGVKNPRWYTPEFKRQAVALAEQIGSTLRAAQQLGVSQGNIYSWRDKIKPINRSVISVSASKVEPAEEELKRLRRECAELKKVIHILKAAAAFFFAGPSQVKFEMVLKMSQECIEVKVSCEVLEVSRSGFYAWQGRPEADRILTDKMKEIHKSSRGTYGAPRLVERLRATGNKCSKVRVARLMNEAGVSGVAKERYRIKTTDSNQALSRGWVFIARLLGAFYLSPPNSGTKTSHILNQSPLFLNNHIKKLSKPMKLDFENLAANPKRGCLTL